jgi:N-acetylmuramoyl-L-alanine amidase
MTLTISTRVEGELHLLHGCFFVWQSIFISSLFRLHFVLMGGHYDVPMKTTAKYLVVATVGAILSSIILHTHSEGATKISNQSTDDIVIVDEVNLPLEGKTIVLDPGHGGKDVGSTGSHGTYEKDVTLLTALNVRSKLVEQGANVLMTRDADTSISLEDRTELAQTENADLFLSIHFDAFESGDVHGMTTYYTKLQDEELAEHIHDELIRNDTGMKDRGVSIGDYHVLRENTKPAVLLELGYMSNPDDEARMQSELFQEQVSTNIVSGVMNVLG